MRRITKKESEELKRLHRFKCRVKYNSLLFAYFSDFCVKLLLVYAMTKPLIILLGLTLNPDVLKYLAYFGVTVDFSAKWYQLRNMKFRKHGIYKRKRK